MKHGGNVFEIEQKYGFDRRCLLDFSANINPLGVPKLYKKMMMDAFDDLINYPDINYFDLKNDIGEKYNLSVENIFVGNGGVQVIFDFIKAINPKKSLVVYPTFGEYERAIRATGGQVEEFFLKEEEDFQLNAEEIMERIHRDLDLVVLCNPNNPTGTLTNKSLLENLLKKCRENNVFLMIDEAFMDFVEGAEEYSLLSQVETYDNLLITRSFTKFYGIPGLRLGFGVCSHPEIKGQLREHGIPWQVNTFGSYFGRVLLEDGEYEKKTHLWLKEETPRFVEELKKLALFKVYPPSVNYILLKLLPSQLDVKGLKERLLVEKILVRDCSNFKGLSDRFIRIAIKGKQDNDRLLEVLKRI
ncbi:threonine-phosphate decarboxylase CobD [Alkaliphilus hydrothermalis]|uniref:threonine-phosphate decarboxylase n=1 Tax=Alkaliphilus hydrothermalis TaxID=1482730 RepID=A0ABS2NN80_9FIRM|nr:threonine-phosphate decarboxylase CobD [Alkaliphilus hydrothermalis]MBM7614407.1 threonine-phosphate decarboxylase [Alkaliphilus hydrothermalis]